MARSPTSPWRTSVSTSAQTRTSPYDRIKEAILSGDILPDEQLVESALAKWCGVSRTPIREALMRLGQDGLVHRGERGLVVLARSQEEILDLYDIRIVLERHAAAGAAERRTSHDMLIIRRSAEQYTRCDSSDNRALADDNRRFHRAVWWASHNASLIDLLERLNMHLGRYPTTTLAYPGRFTAANNEHVDLVEAIEAHNSDRAAAIASQHFTAAREIRLRLYETEQYWAGDKVIGKVSRVPRQL